MLCYFRQGKRDYKEPSLLYVHWVITKYFKNKLTCCELYFMCVWGEVDWSNKYMFWMLSVPIVVTGLVWFLCLMAYQPL